MSPNKAKSNGLTPLFYDGRGFLAGGCQPRGPAFCLAKYSVQYYLKVNEIAGKNQYFHLYSPAKLFAHPL
jgi:hypothetical protein